MARQKIYTEEFLVRSTVEELRRIDDLAKKSGKSRSRLLVLAALRVEVTPSVESLQMIESMLEMRGMALMELRKVRCKLEKIAQSPELQPALSGDIDLAAAIRDLMATTRLLRET
jgi:hypothetical protein